MKYFIIVAGPTASGKGSAPNKIKRYLGLEDDHVNILIDDLVEKNPFYRDGVEHFIASKKELKHSNDDIVKMFENPTPDDIQTFNELYYTSRNQTNCFTGELVDRDPRNACDAINDRNLDTAFENNHNVVFETMGEHWPRWLFDRYRRKLQTYQIIVAYSIVDLCELICRNITRSSESIVKFMRNTDSETPPRLPDIQFEPYKKRLQTIVKVFKEQNKTKGCAGTSLKSGELCIRYLLFDNRGLGDSEVLYDSKCDHASVGDDLIDAYLKEIPYRCIKK